MLSAGIAQVEKENLNAYVFVCNMHFSAFQAPIDRSSCR
jgi:hypothetical protein